MAHRRSPAGRRIQAGAQPTAYVLPRVLYVHLHKHMGCAKGSKPWAVDDKGVGDQTLVRKGGLWRELGNSKLVTRPLTARGCCEGSWVTSISGPQLLSKTGLAVSLGGSVYPIGALLCHSAPEGDMLQGLHHRAPQGHLNHRCWTRSPNCALIRAISIFIRDWKQSPSVSGKTRAPNLYTHQGIHTASGKSHGHSGFGPRAFHLP